MITATTERHYRLWEFPTLGALLDHYDSTHDCVTDDTPAEAIWPVLLAVGYPTNPPPDDDEFNEPDKFGRSIDLTVTAERYPRVIANGQDMGEASAVFLGWLAEVSQ